MDITKIIIKIIHIPSTFYAKKNVSFVELLKKAGYFELEDGIEERQIFKELNNYPNDTPFWLQWSEDKRTDKGWYINAINNKQFAVSFLDGGKILMPQIYSNELNACAAFIKQEIEQVKINHINKMKK